MNKPENPLAKFRQTRAFTIPELLIAVLILMPLCVLTMKVFIDCLRINELSRNSSLAISACVTRMSNIENTPYNQIAATYNNQTFTAAGINGIGVTYVDDSNANYLIIINSFCWRENNQRLIGEDANLDGNWTVLEDKNGNHRIDSPIQLVSIIFNS